MGDGGDDSPTFCQRCGEDVQAETSRYPGGLLRYCRSCWRDLDPETKAEIAEVIEAEYAEAEP